MQDHARIAQHGVKPYREEARTGTTAIRSTRIETHVPNLGIYEISALNYPKRQRFFAYMLKEGNPEQFQHARWGIVGKPESGTAPRLPRMWLGSEWILELRV